MLRKVHAQRINLHWSSAYRSIQERPPSLKIHTAWIKKNLQINKTQKTILYIPSNFLYSFETRSFAFFKIPGFDNKAKF